MCAVTVDRDYSIFADVIYVSRDEPLRGGSRVLFRRRFDSRQVKRVAACVQDEHIIYAPEASRCRIREARDNRVSSLWMHDATRVLRRVVLSGRICDGGQDGEM